MTAQGTRVRASGRRVSSSAPFRVLARAGLVARGVIYVLVGSPAVNVAFGDHSKAAVRVLGIGGAGSRRPPAHSTGAGRRSPMPCGGR
jgi:hypothetical protein